MAEFEDLEEGHGVEAKVVKLFVVVSNTDTTEGKGSRVDVSYHLTNHDAVIGSSKRGVWGADADVKTRLALELEDGRYMLLGKYVQITENAEEEAKLRESALAKLSPAEKEALLGKEV